MSVISAFYVFCQLRVKYYITTKFIFEWYFAFKLKINSFPFMCLYFFFLLMRVTHTWKFFNYFAVLLTVHLSIFISVINQLDAQIFLFYNKFISCPYMFRAHVLIMRRSKFHYTASGIITLKQVSGLKFCNFRPLTCFSVMIPEAV